MCKCTMKTKALTRLTSVVFLLVLLAINTSNAIQAQSIRIIIPSAQSDYIQNVFQPLGYQLTLSESIYLELIPVEPQLNNLASVTQVIINEGNGPVIWLAGPAATDFYEQHTDFFQPEGVIPLGAGWQHGRPDTNITLSLPRRISTMPVISLAIIASPYNGEYDDLVQTFIHELFNSYEGLRALRSLTVLPAVHDIDGVGVTMLFQPDRMEDDCGCGEMSMCDPDVRYPRSMIGLDRVGNRVVLPIYNFANDDDNNCDPCDDNRVTWHDWQLETVYERLLNAGQDQNELMEHLNALEEIHYNGGVVIVMTCDPD